MKSVQIILSATILLCSPVILKAGGKQDFESRELSNLTWEITRFFDKNPDKIPENWADIWDEDSLVNIYIKSPLGSPAHERYWFVSNNYPMPTSYQGRQVDGEILLLKKEPTDYQERELSTAKEGRWWEFIWIENSNNGAPVVKIGSLPVDALQIGSEKNHIQLKKPNVSHNKVVSLKNRLSDLGFDFPFRTETDADQTHAVAAKESISKQSVQEKIQSTKSIAFPWLFVIVGIILLAVIAVIGFKVLGKSS